LQAALNCQLNSEISAFAIDNLADVVGQVLEVEAAAQTTLVQAI
jgi:hypothetical protein